jgi:hypothetical protein
MRLRIAFVPVEFITDNLTVKVRQLERWKQSGDEVTEACDISIPVPFIGHEMARVRLGRDC